MKTGWIFVVLTCVLELLWVYGFNVVSQYWHLFILIFVMLVDFYCMKKACESLPTGTVYAIFAGIGTAGTALMDIYLFDVPFTALKVLFILLIILGVVFLNLSDIKASKQKSKGQN